MKYDYIYVIIIKSCHMVRDFNIDVVSAVYRKSEVDKTS